MGTRLTDADHIDEQLDHDGMSDSCETSNAIEPKSKKSPASSAKHKTSLRGAAAAVVAGKRMQMQAAETKFQVKFSTSQPLARLTDNYWCMVL